MFNDFKSVDKITWKTQIEKDLKGKPYQELIWQLGEDIVLEPFYQQADTNATRPPLHQHLANEWNIGEWIAHNDQKQANALALEALSGGANALTFVINRGVSQTELGQLLDGIELPYISTHFYYEGKKVNMAQKKMEHFYHYAQSKGFDTTQLQGSLQIAPLGAEPNWKSVAALSQWLHKHLPNFKSLVINGNEFYTDDTATATSLAKIIHRATHTIEMLQSQGMDIAQINNMMSFNILIGKSYFVNIAKIRALKLLWLNIQKTYHIENATLPPIVAHFDTRAYDDNPNTNMIRATTMALSAAIGGCDTLCVLPSDMKGETAFSRRIARNVQHLLKMESYINQVADPAAGAYYIEQLTDELALKAWDIFKKM